MEFLERLNFAFPEDTLAIELTRTQSLEDGDLGPLFLANPILSPCRLGVEQMSFLVRGRRNQG